MRCLKHALLIVTAAAFLVVAALAFVNTRSFTRLLSANAHLAEIATAFALTGFVSIALVKMDRHTIARAASSRQPLTSPRAPSELPPRLAAGFDYPRLARPMARELAVERDHDLTLRTIQLSTTGPREAMASTIDLEYLVPAKPGKHPVVVILPIMAGKLTMARFFADGFVSQGMAVVLVKGGRTPIALDSFEALELALRRTVVADRQVLDWIETRAELDAERISVLGLSLGAIRGTLLTAVEPRIKSAVLARAGGNLARIAMTSSERLLVTLRKTYARAHNLTGEALAKALRAILVSDPIAYAPFIDPRKVLLVLARYDTSVPYASGVELRSAMGHPETITLPTGHYTSIFFAPFVRDEALDFLRQGAERRMASGRDASSGRGSRLAIASDWQ